MSSSSAWQSSCLGADSLGYPHPSCAMLSPSSGLERFEQNAIHPSGRSHVWFTATPYLSLQPQQTLPAALSCECFLLDCFLTSSFSYNTHFCLFCMMFNFNDCRWNFFWCSGIGPLICYNNANRNGKISSIRCWFCISSSVRKDHYRSTVSSSYIKIFCPRYASHVSRQPRPTRT